MKKVIFLMVAFLFLITGIAFGQHDVDMSINISQGNIFQSSNYSGLVVTDDNEYIKDQYQNNFRGIQAYGVTYEHTNNGEVSTKITGGSHFGVPGLSFKEVIGTNQVDIDGKDCCGVAAGSKFSLYGVNEFESNASEGGTGACCGVNYNMKATEGAGTLEAAVIDKRIGEDIVPAENEGEEDTTLYGNSIYKYEFKTQNSVFGNAKFNVTAPPCTPEAPADPVDPGIFELCPWDTGGFTPFQSMNPQVTP